VQGSGSPILARLQDRAGRDSLRSAQREQMVGSRQREKRAEAFRRPRLNLGTSRLSKLREGRDVQVVGVAYTLVRMHPIATSLLLLGVANVFMTFAWYGHLKTLAASPLWVVILASWSIALFEYCFQVPANRIGYTAMTLGQLKVSQEVITMIIFMVFSVAYMKKPLSMDLIYATGCLVLAAYFVFRNGAGEG
jgi:uncharacterized protein